MGLFCCIFEIRGQRVILDFFLAELYEVETRALNQAVKRNIDRFPMPDFMIATNDIFQALTELATQKIEEEIKKTRTKH